MSRFHPNMHALAALAFLGAHERSLGNPMGPTQGFDLAPEYEEPPAAFLGNDFLGNDYLGAEALMGADPLMGLDTLLGNDPLALLGSDQLAALLGAEGAAMLGRDPRRARALAARAAAARARAAGAAPAGVSAVAREGYLPIPQTAIATGATAVINIFPQAQGGIQLTRLMIPSNQGVRYLINDVVVATRSQFFSPGAVSAVLCSEVQTMKLRGDVAYPGTIVSISVQNVSGADQTLAGAAFLAEAREARTV
jgi:hypothetical protein